MPSLGFCHDSTIAKKEVYDVLFYFKKGKNEGRHRKNDQNVNVNVTGCRRRDERARGGGPT
jgi:hypothetical protein